MKITSLKPKVEQLSAQKPKKSLNLKIIQNQIWSNIFVVSGGFNYIAVDTETTGLNHHHGDKPFAISMAWRDKDDEIKTGYIQCSVDPFTREPQWRDSRSLPHLIIVEAILKDTKTAKIFHNAKFDINMLASIGLKVAGPIHDTQLMARCVNTLEDSFKLKKLCQKYLGIEDDDQKDLQSITVKARNVAKKLGYKPWPFDAKVVATDYWLAKQIWPDNDSCQKYAIRDAERTLQLYEFLDQAVDHFDVRHSYNTEIELLEILRIAENRGVRLDYEENLREIESISREIDNIAQSFPINIDSPKQLGPYLYDELKFPRPPKKDKAKTDQPTTDNEYLEQFAEEGNEIDKILTRRGMKNGLNFHKEYNLLAIKAADCWEIHANFNQASTRTFRLSCSNPNLQNVPNPETSGGYYVIDVRKVIGPRPGYYWYCIDYSGLELRLFADLAQEDFMLHAFEHGIDIHDEVRKNIPQLAELPQKIGRKFAKNVSFCKIFGGGGRALIKYIKPKGSDLEKLNYCKEIIKQYDREYPKIVGYINKISNIGKRDGFIRNAYGRRISVESEFAYKACNYNIQSSAADLIKAAMIKINKLLLKEKLDAHIVLQVHDELVIEIKKEHAYKDVLLQIRELMSNSDGHFNIKTPVEVKRTWTNWSKATDKGMEWINLQNS